MEAIRESKNSSQSTNAIKEVLEKIELSKYKHYPLVSYSTLRSLNYLTQFQILDSFSKLIPGLSRPFKKESSATKEAIYQSVIELYKYDAQNILDGIYPWQVLVPESPIKHLSRFPKLVWDGIQIYRKRHTRSARIFSKQAEEYLKDLPEYYKRNFHFQTDGYLSSTSAELYEHQVELLFLGAADPMRRLIIPALKKHFNNSDGERLTFLEVGAGTGRATKFVKLAFPKAKIVVNDISYPYLQKAQERLAKLTKLDFIQAPAESLPFQKEHFDAVFSVFLFHELPIETRKAVIKEGLRVLKKGGFYGLVDSIQVGDLPDFNEVLKSFPLNFHEPFYKHYIENPMDELMKQLKIKRVSSHLGFLSKAVWGQK